MKQRQIFSIALLTATTMLVINSCKKPQEETPETPATTAACVPASLFTAPTGPNLVFKFKFDSTQARLNNIGQPVGIGAGNAAQTPRSFRISQHYIELAGDFDALGGGRVLSIGQETTAGGTSAIDYCASTLTGENVVFFAKPLSQITPGTFKWLRVSLAFQTYDIIYKSNYLTTPNHTAQGTVASFIGYNTYIKGYQVNGHDYSPSTSAGGVGNHLQGYWGFETSILGTNYFTDGQAPANATTVPNPNFANSPIPQGSCVVTGQFVNLASTQTPLVITGLETQDIVITVSLSINKSFEWHEAVADGIYQPEVGDVVIDMGVRGLIPFIN